MTAPEQDSTRILIGASSFADAAVALRLIEQIMRDLRPHLGGILVDETAALAMCAMPDQRVISASGQVVLAPNPAQFSTLIDADARAFRNALARLAGIAGETWTFQREIGDLIETGLDTSAAVDILVFAHRQIHPVAGKIVVLSSSATADSDAVAMSRLLARHLSADHIVMTIGRPDTRAAAPQDHFDTLEAALARLTRINAQAVFVDLAHGPVRTTAALRRLLDVARCPVFVLQAASAAQTLEHAIHIPPVPDRGAD